VSETPLYGLVAEFDDPTQLIEAARAVRKYGYRRFEAYSPYPIEELDEIIKLDTIIPGFNPLPAMVFLAGLAGAIGAWFMEYYIAVFQFPLNVGGRPLYSWPLFIVIMFEVTILFAGCAVFFGGLLLCGLPRPYFPLFNLRRFASASQDRFFLCVEARDAVFDLDRTTELLEGFHPREVWEVEK